jgi:hypothetical protein
VFGASAPDIAGLQAPDKETHPFPSGLLARQMKKFARLLRSKIPGMYKKIAFTHIAPRAILSRLPGLWRAFSCARF